VIRRIPFENAFQLGRLKFGRRIVLAGAVVDLPALFI